MKPLGFHLTECYRKPKAALVVPRSHQGPSHLSALPSFSIWLPLSNLSQGPEELLELHKSWLYFRQPEDGTREESKIASLTAEAIPFERFPEGPHPHASYRSETNHVDTSKHKGDWGIGVFHLGALSFVIKWEFSYWERRGERQQAGNQQCLPRGETFSFDQVEMKTSWEQAGEKGVWRGVSWSLQNWSSFR